MPVIAIRERIHSYTMRMLAAWLGAGLFFTSLAYFAYFYLIVLGRPALVPVEQVPAAVGTNVALFSAFALHHSLFARIGIKAVVARVLPAAFERTAYVSIASLLFLGVCLLWRPLPGTAWDATGLLRLLLYGVQFAGLVVTVQGASRLDIWDLSGVRQVRAASHTARVATPRVAVSSSAPNVPPPATSPATVSAPLEVRGPYRWLRHPIYLGWVLLVFGAPTMTAGRLLFAAVSTTYLVVAIPIEERSLVDEFGQSYRDYQRQVRWRLLPGLW
jgi:protein-S-isoprenylcysteine O-methyltransferase Ste14